MGFAGAEAVEGVVAGFRFSRMGRTFRVGGGLSVSVEQEDKDDADVCVLVELVKYAAVPRV